MTEPAAFTSFRAFSARLGQDPLRVQGPGGNTSLKDGARMWIKASGTELADAEDWDIFVAVDLDAARKEAREEAGDGSCKTTVLDPAQTLRPSIETTFHAALDWPVVAHTHSIATLCHAISPQGRAAADTKLAGLPFARVPYAKPGLPLTREILRRAAPGTQVFVLENHGLICCAESVEACATLMDEVEARLALPVLAPARAAPAQTPPDGFHWTAESWLAQDAGRAGRALAGSYYPDHVVFLGPALPERDHDGHPPALLVRGAGTALRDGATPSQTAMLACLADVMARLPAEWEPAPIGAAAEGELLDWDAEKYRQALAARS
ncbi:MAG: class II aldolase/adducin family protein [Pseudomonadota bacterium]